MGTFTSTEPYTKNYRHIRDAKNVHHPTHIGGLKLCGGVKETNRKKNRKAGDDRRYEKRTCLEHNIVQ